MASGYYGLLLRCLLLFNLIPHGELIASSIAMVKGIYLYMNTILVHYIYCTQVYKEQLWEFSVGLFC